MNILVVDDDALIRNWLSMLLRQAKGDAVFIMEATDGVDALEICEETSVDLVITDIKMPRMNGIDLIGTLKTEYPKIRTAVLSSYDDFDYVRIALKCGALDYIRKAEMQMEDIEALLEKTVRDIELEQSVKKGEQPRHMALADVKQGFLAYLGGKTSLEDFLSGLQPPISKEGLNLVLVRMQEQDGVDLPQYVVAGVCDDTLKNENLIGVAFPWGKEYYVLLYNGSGTSAEHQQAEYQKLLVLLDKNLETYVGVPLSNSIHLPCHAKDELADVFNKGLDIMDFREYYGMAAPQQHAGAELSSGRKQQAIEMQKALDVQDYAKAVGILKSYLEKAHATRLVPRRIKHLVVSGMNALLTVVALTEQKNDVLDRLGAYPGIVMDAHKKERLVVAVNQFCAQFLAHSQSLQSQLSPVVRSAILYIEQNYPHKLTLDDVAAHVFLNRSYLSQLFKKEMNIPFGDYLESVRLQKAKNLIRNSNKPMSEIAEVTGFSNQNYFTKVFKKATGVSPLKYRRQ